MPPQNKWKVLEWKETTPRIDVIGYKFVHPVTSIRGLFSSNFTSYQVYWWGGFGMEKIIPRIDVKGCKFVHLLHLFVECFSIKFTSFYVYSWGGFGKENHLTNRRNK